MQGCETCSSCAGCSGCASMELNEGELSVLELLAQIPFLPVSRRADSAEPIFREAETYTQAEYSLILQCLEKKGLITIDFDRPLKGWRGYEAGLIPGSIALTARGQQVLTLLDLHGLT